MVPEEKTREELEREIQELQHRLEVTEETLRAIRDGEVDAIVIGGPEGERIFTLQGADYAYRLLVEEMKEGAATLTDDGMILYCNRRLSSLLKQPLEELIGCQFKQFVTLRERSLFQALCQQAKTEVGKGELCLVASDGSEIPVYVSINLLSMNGVKVICLIATDLSEQKRNEELVADERLARSILEQAAEAIIVCDEKGKIIRASQTAYQLCGKNPLLQQFDVVFPLQYNNLNLFTMENQQRRSAKKLSRQIKDTSKRFSISDVLAGGSLQGVELFLSRKARKIFYLLLSARPLLNSNSELRGCVVTLTDISRRKQIEEALQASEERFRRAVINSPLPIMLHAEDGEILQINGSWTKITGYTYQDIPTIAAWEKKAYKTPSVSVKKEMESLYNLDRSFLQGEYTVTTSDGATRVWDFYSAALGTLPDGRRMIISTARDITENKQAEAALQKAKDELEIRVTERTSELTKVNEQLQVELVERQQIQEMLQEQAELLELAHDAILTIDFNDIITFWNRGAEEIYGFSKQEALGKVAHELLQTEFPEPLSAIKAKLLQEGRWEGEPIQKKRDGTELIVASRWAIQKDLSGKPLKILEINSDITSAKQTEEALINSGVRLASILDLAEDAIISINENLKITIFNKAAENIFGYSVKEAIAQPIGNLLPAVASEPESQQEDEFSNLVKQLQSMKNSRDIFGRCKNGDEFPIEVSISQLDLGNEKILTMILRDITERIQAELELHKANENLSNWVKELEQRNREIALLSELSDILQACQNLPEAYQALTALIQPLFPNVSGGVFAIGESKQIVEAVAIWGETAFNSQTVFLANECWGLRRGRSHFVESSQTGLLCKHIHQNSSIADTLCVPMMAQGEALGVLYLFSPQKEQFTPAKQHLAVMVAEHIALALANLKLHEALRQQSIRDALTGLYNRRYLEESLEREINRAERQHKKLGVIMLDVDYFKQFNDTYGHKAGDVALRELGLFLRNNIRRSDIACRYGGEELTLIMPETSLEVTLERAEEIRKGVKLLDLSSNTQRWGNITVSLGVAVFPEHGATGEAVIQAADAALYQAKQQGRDRVVCALNDNFQTDKQSVQ